MHIACKQVANATKGGFQCYMSQEGASIASLGMVCRTGTCLYGDPQPQPPPAPGPLPPTWRPHPEVGVLVAVALAVASLLAVAGAFTWRDRRRSEAWAVAASGSKERGGSGSSAGTGVSEAALMEALLGEAEEEAAAAGQEGGLGGTLLPAAASAVGATGGVPEVVLTWHHIGYRVVTPQGIQRQVLSHVSGVAGSSLAYVAAAADADVVADPGGSSSGSSGSSGSSKMMAILGPSGSGKTSLLDILAGRRAGPRVAGQVRAGSCWQHGGAPRHPSQLPPPLPHLPASALHCTALHCSVLPCFTVLAGRHLGHMACKYLTLLNALCLPTINRCA